MVMQAIGYIWGLVVAALAMLAMGHWEPALGLLLAATAVFWRTRVMVMRREW